MRTLLIADDAAIIREIIRDTTTQAGWQVVGQADNGLKAHELFRALRPSAMTLDMVMPQYDGLYALEHILAEFPDAKIVVVSALDQKQVLKEAFKLGAADFLVKPFDRRLLLETLDRVVGREDVPEAAPLAAN